MVEDGYQRIIDEELAGKEALNAMYEQGVLDSTNAGECIWEKASPDDVTVWTYYPPCYGMTDINGISGFKFCPYCGKKLGLKLRP